MKAFITLKVILKAILIKFLIDRSLISNFRYLMLRDLHTYLPSNLLVKIDRASMANSLEVRSPYLDPSLGKFVWSLPDHYISRNNYGQIYIT